MNGAQLLALIESPSKSIQGYLGQFVGVFQYGGRLNTRTVTSYLDAAFTVQKGFDVHFTQPQSQP